MQHTAEQATSFVNTLTQGIKTADREDDQRFSPLFTVAELINAPLQLLLDCGFEVHHLNKIRLPTYILHWMKPYEIVYGLNGERAVLTGEYIDALTSENGMAPLVFEHREARVT